MRRALRLAKRGFGRTSPNPMVGAVLSRKGVVLGEGWHRRAGHPHAEIEALRAAGSSARGATLHVTLEPCSTHGRTPPCTEAILAAGIRRLVVAAADPNPAHDGKGLEILARAGLEVVTGVLKEESTRMNEAFNHWIVQRAPFVTVKAAMSLDGRIATTRGESKWITGEKARSHAMRLRREADAILVGVNTIIKDDPSLTVRGNLAGGKRPLRIILDPTGRTPPAARVLTDSAAPTMIVVGRDAPAARVRTLEKRARILVAPARAGGIDLQWLLRELGRDEITSLLVEGGGETNASFLLAGFAQRAAFFYAPLVLGGVGAPKGVAGTGVLRLKDGIALREAHWRRFGPDLFLTARVAPSKPDHG